MSAEARNDRREGRGRLSSIDMLPEEAEPDIDPEDVIPDEPIIQEQESE